MDETGCFTVQVPKKVLTQQGVVVVVVVRRASTPGQTQTGLGPRVYPFTTPDCCTASI